MEKGLGVGDSALLLTMFVVGSVIGQFPLGWLAGHVDRRRLLAVCVFAAMGSLGMLPVVIGNLLLTWLVMMLLGVTLGSFYVISMAMIGARFKGSDLVGINASFVFLWELGSVIGPTISGTAMDTMGPEGMPLVGCVLCALFLGFLLWRIKVMEPVERALV